MESTELIFPIMLTLRACAVGLVLFGIFAVPLAFWLSRHEGTVTRVVTFFVTLPLIFPPIALGYLLLLLLGKQGPVGMVMLGAFDTRLIFNEFGVYLAAFIAGLPLVVRPLQIAFSSQRLLQVEEAARVCGAGKLTTFFFVTLPLVRNSLIAGMLLGVARACGEVGITMMLGGNISDRTNTLSLEIFNCVSRGDFDTASMLCGVLAGVALLLYVCLEFFQSKKVF